MAAKLPPSVASRFPGARPATTQDPGTTVPVPQPPTVDLPTDLQVDRVDRVDDIETGSRPSHL